MSLSNGAIDCPCIDLSSYAPALDNCIVADGDNDTITETGFWVHADVWGGGGPVTGHCYPTSYGSSVCTSHDLLYDPLCTSSSSSSNVDDRPLYCQDEWCYVDAEKCKDSNQQYFLSEVEGLRRQKIYYSHSTCNSTSDAWHKFSTINPLAGRDITVTIPGIWAPAHYKDVGPDGDKWAYYYNDTVPWQGWVIEFLEAVLAISNIGSFNYTYRSVGSSAISSAKYTAAIGDVRAGITDIVASSLWITPERLSMSPFTTQTETDKIYLWTAAPTLTSGYAEKVLEPFDPMLWLCMLLSILVVSGLSIWFATPMSTHRKWYKDVNSESWKSANVPQRIYKRLRILFDAFIAYSTFFFGHTVEYDIRASYPSKILNFGFGFLILIAVSAFTANLAAFLTLQGVSSYIESMEAAMSQNIVLCAPLALKKDLVQVWPRASFQFYVNASEHLFSMYDSNVCGAFLGSFFDMRQNPIITAKLCEREVVRTNSIALEIPLGFAASPDIVAGLSYWMEQAEKNEISFKSFEADTLPPISCSLDIPTVQVNELVSLTPANFVLPFTVFGVCAAVAIILHLNQKRWDKMAEREEERNRLQQEKMMAENEDEHDLVLQAIKEHAPYEIDQTGATDSVQSKSGAFSMSYMNADDSAGSMWASKTPSPTNSQPKVRQRRRSTHRMESLMDLASNNDEMATLLDMMKDISDRNDQMHGMVADMQAKQTRFHAMVGQGANDQVQPEDVP